jgi:phosphatidylserine/phosphatidylglycerophosphate/cardiolipin synthase-like enzyme
MELGHAHPIASPARPMAAASTPSLVIGGRDVLAASREVADSARQVLRVDTFRTSSEPNVDAVVAAARRGVDVHALVDTDTAADSPAFRDSLAGIATVTEYGAEPFKQHGKAISRDGADALVATDVSDAKSLHRLEMGVRFGGPAAAAFDAVQQLTPGSSRSEANAAFEDARRAGIVVNDPHHEHRGVSATLDQLVDDASSDLLVVSKLFDSGGLAKQLAHAAERGVATTVVTHEIDSGDADRLRDAGVDVRVVDYASAAARDAALHGTVIAADDAALLTTMPLAKKAIKGSDGRQSRELGVVLDGALAHRLTDAVRSALLTG